MQKKSDGMFDSFYSNNKKGQVTIFIILGIVLLLAVVLILTLKREVTVFKPEEVAVTDKGKVENFVTSCIKDIGEDALLKLGLQGGYIEVPDNIVNNGNRHVRTSPFTVIPYWAQGLAVEIPTIDDMKLQIDDYLEQNVKTCLLGTQAFNQEFLINERSPIKSDTKITENGIVFQINWDIDVENRVGDVVARVTQHVVESPIKLKQVYETSVRIINRELAELKLEDITQDLLALEHPKVPLAGFEFSCAKKTWNVDDTENTLKDMLRINIGALQVEGAEFNKYGDDDPYYKNHYLWNLGVDPVPSDLSVAFNFDNNYPFVFEITPRRGSKLESNQMGGQELLSLFCMQNWKFVYTINYPVVIDVMDEKNKYHFKTAFTVHIDNNIPNRESTYLNFNPIPKVPTIGDEEFCADVTVPMFVKTYEVIDNGRLGVYLKEPLSDVNLSLTCLRFRCDVGKSEYNFGGRGHIAAFGANFPYCAGGILRGEKYGYKESWKRVVTEPDLEVELELLPIFRFPSNKIKIVEHTILDGKIGPGVPASSDTMAIIDLLYKKINSTNLLHESRTVARNVDDERLVQGYLELLAKADFRYNLDVQVVQGQKMIGVYKGNWTANWDKLELARELVIHVAKSENQNEFANIMRNIVNISKSLPEPELLR